MDVYRIDFEGMDWEAPIRGMRQKVCAEGSRRVRLVEYTPEMEPHWCEKGHYGYIIEGRISIEFDSGSVIFGPGDGVFIPGGAGHRHIGRALSPVVRAVFVEDV